MNRFSGVFLILCASCSANFDTTNEAGYDPHAAFNDFPDSLYYGVYFNQPIVDAQENLQEHGFRLVDSSGSFRYKNQSDSAEVILQQTDELHTMKIILRSADQLYLKESLRDIFAMSASSYDNSAEFAVYHYTREKNSFEVTLFEQQEFIRLYFEEKLTK